MSSEKYPLPVMAQSATLDPPWSESVAAGGVPLAPESIASSPARGRWLFSAPVDLGAFLGSAVVAFALLALGWRFGLLDADSPDWTWVTAVLLIDVAHVYATAFRVYFDAEEFKRRVWLYALVPLLAYGMGVALYTESERMFWRALAYLAVFHFVRQQYGWVALYRARAGERDRLGKWIDGAAIYLATAYPLVYWHANLPRHFWWFLPGDFATLPAVAAQVVAPFYWAALGAYGLRSLWRWLVKGEANPGKDIVVMTTAACWYLGIVAFNSDYAFTVTNVIIHGVPYLVLIYWYARMRREQTESRAYRLLARGPVIFLATLWLLAYVEELVWHRGVWHERSWLFGGAWDATAIKAMLVPLLALPQVTHYVLDGFIWRRKSNPSLALLAQPERR